MCLCVIEENGRLSYCKLLRWVFFRRDLWRDNDDDDDDSLGSHFVAVGFTRMKGRKNTIGLTIFNGFF